MMYELVYWDYENCIIEGIKTVMFKLNNKN